jgi:anti-anti-sigma factor
MSCPRSLFSASGVHVGGSVLVLLRGELDIATAPILRRAVRGLLTPHTKAVTLDLADLAFVDVLGLQAIVDVKQLAVGMDAEFRLQSPSDSTLRVIRLARFDELRVVPSPIEPGLTSDHRHRTREDNY